MSRTTAIAGRKRNPSYSSASRKSPTCAYRPKTTGATKTSYIIGDDVLAQAIGNASNAPKYLLYDGHGSTRQLINSAGTSIILS